MTHEHQAFFMGGFPPPPGACPLTPEKREFHPVFTCAPFAEHGAFPGMEQKRSMIRKKRGKDGRIGRSMTHDFNRPAVKKRRKR